MARRNRVDPWGDLHAVSPYGMFTGNRGCLVTEQGGPAVRHHNGSLWIICRTRFRDWRHPLAAPRTWTPLFFLDDAVALAAGHRPCGLCRRQDYLAYRHGVTVADVGPTGPVDDSREEQWPPRPVLAQELNSRLAAERLRRGRGLERRADRIHWSADIGSLPIGTVVLDDDHNPQLLTERHLQPFGFDGWGPKRPRPTGVRMEVLTPPTSVAALRNGFAPTLHPSAAG